MSTRFEFPDMKNNAGKFLRVNATETDGEWVSAPSGSGTVTSVGTSGPLTGGPITTTGTIGITQSGTLTDGYLSSADWNTFNNKQNAITPGDLTTSTSGVTIGTGTGKLLGNATVNISTASGSQQGLLSAADWTTFNNKQNALAALTIVKAYKSGIGAAASPFIFNSESYDTSSAYDNATGIFTAPTTGYYLVSAYISVETHIANPTTVDMVVVKNGSTDVAATLVRLNGYEGASDFWIRKGEVTSVVQLNANDTIQVNLKSSGGTIGTTGGVYYNQLNITQLR